MGEPTSTTTTPKVSVCIPAYRADRYLEATLRSVGTQTFRDWELIVTEDGSEDRTGEFVRDFAATVPQPVLYNRHEVNHGLPATRNTGIITARGTWIAFLDSDDLWQPDHLESLIGASHLDDYDMIFAGSVLYDDATWDKIETRAPSETDLADLPVALYTGRLSIMPSAVMIKREAFSRFGLISAEFPHCNDTEYWLRLLSMGGRLCYSGKNTCIYRRHTSSMSRRTVEILTDSARLCERYASWAAIPRFLSHERPANLYRWAAHTLLPEDPQAASDLLRHAFRLQPFSAKTVGLWAKALLHQNAQRRNAA